MHNLNVIRVGQRLQNRADANSINLSIDNIVSDKGRLKKEMGGGGRILVDE